MNKLFSRLRDVTEYRPGYSQGFLSYYIILLSGK